MTDAPVQIRKPSVVRKIRRLATTTGRPITDAVESAVDEALGKAAPDDDLEARRKRVDEIIRKFNALPIVGPLLTDEDFYDEDGFPK